MVLLVLLLLKLLVLLAWGVARYSVWMGAGGCRKAGRGNRLRVQLVDLRLAGVVCVIHGRSVIVGRSRCLAGRSAKCRQRPCWR